MSSEVSRVRSYVSGRVLSHLTSPRLCSTRDYLEHLRLRELYCHPISHPIHLRVAIRETNVNMALHLCSFSVKYALREHLRYKYYKDKHVVKES